MKTILESLKSYFSSTALDQIELDWAVTEKYDKVGPCVDDFLNQSRMFYEAEIRQSYWEFSNQNQIIQNPKFASDFFLY